MEEKKELEHQKTTHALKLIIVAFLCFVVIIFIFSVGVFVGQERAEFSFRWAENYHRNFGGPNRGIFGNFPAQDFINGHGIFGSVIKIDGDNIIIKGQDNIEKTVIVSGQTTIVNASGKTTLSNIKTNDMMVVIGSPDQTGSVIAKFIRILPKVTSYIFNNINI